MATEKQIAANRANARKSTGPKTTAGKSRSSANSRKHGLTAETLVIVGEKADDFDALRAELFEEFDPQTALECELVERLTGILWRLRRAPYYEAAIMHTRYFQTSKLQTGGGSIAFSLVEGQPEGEEETELKNSVRFGCALINDACLSDALGKLDRHETTLMNSLAKTLQLLLLFQENHTSQRKPERLEAVLLPAAA